MRLGLLKPGDKVPSVRALTVELGINPNTVQKAYDELSSHGLLSSVPGRGCFVTREAPDILRNEALQRLPELSALAKELALSGIDRQIIEKTVHEATEI